MKFQINSNADKYAKLKIGLIPVLMLYLGYALLMPDTKSEVPVTENGAEIEVSVPVDNSSAESFSVETSDVSDTNHFEKKRPSISLAEIAAHDPFQVLAILRPKIEPSKLSDKKQLDHKPDSMQDNHREAIEREKSVAMLAQIKESLKTHVIRGIFITGQKKAVLIDSEVYEEGDFLQEGVRIHQITPTEVVLEIESEGRITLK